MNATVRSAPDFLGVFAACRDAWQAMLELSRRQCALIEAGEYPQLLDVLARKQRLLEQLDGLNARHPRIRAQWRANRDNLDPQTRDDCAHALAETEAILAELRDHEQASTQQLAGRRDRTAEAIKALAAGHDLHDAYRDNLAPATHRHLDVCQ